MSTITTTDGADVSDEDFGEGISGRPNALTTSREERMKDRPRRPAQRTDNGEPDAAPTSHGLFIILWSARRFLRASGLPDDVSVSAKWRTTEGLPSLAEIDLTVTVSRRAEAVSAALATAFEHSLVARSLADPVVHISYEGANR